MLLNLSLSSAVSLDRFLSPGLLRLHWLGLLPSLASPACLYYATQSLRVMVKSCKEVGHLNKVWSVILQNT